MEESLFSQNWYQVEELKPRLRRHVQIHRHRYRGQYWYILQDHSSGRFHRFSPEAYLIIGLMDGERTLGAIWNTACERLGDEMPTQDEVIGLLSQLNQADALQGDSAPDITHMHRRFALERRRRILGYLRSPLSVRLPFWDPEAFLRRTQWLVRPFLGWLGALLWAAVVGPALVLAAMHWNELTANMTDRVLSLENLLVIGLIYPLVKALHEFGHAYMVKRWGGEVHEMGVMLLVFMPVPYVDASASYAFRQKARRMLVGAGGILVEVLVAALAMLVWVYVEAGLVRVLAYNTMLIAGVSTLFFNGNPLLRFDGYYILADYLEIPNLGSRANRYIGYLTQRYTLGIKDAASPASASGEAGWLGWYAVTAFAYRVFIMVSIGIFIAGSFFAAGVAMVLWAAFSMLVLPLVQLGRRVLADGRLRRKQSRIAVVGGSAVGVAATLLLLVPVPLFTVAEGVVWVPDKSRVYGGEDGFVTRVMVPAGQWVRPGDVLVQCRNPVLDARIKELDARLRELDARHRFILQTDRVEAEIIKDEYEKTLAELGYVREQRDGLAVRSPTAGVFLLPRPQDLPERFVRGGTPLGYVVDFSRVTARVVIAQADIERIRLQTRAVEARLAGAHDTRIRSRVVRQVPAASTRLPSPALSLEGGGSIALDPRQGHEGQSYEPLFQVDIELPGSVTDRIGERVFVRFEHDPEALAFRWYRSIRRLLLRQFAV